MKRWKSAPLLPGGGVGGGEEGRGISGGSLIHSERFSTAEGTAQRRAEDGRSAGRSHAGTAAPVRGAAPPAARGQRDGGVREMGRRGAGGCGDSQGTRVAPPALPVLARRPRVGTNACGRRTPTAHGRVSPCPQRTRGGHRSPPRGHRHDGQGGLRRSPLGSTARTPAPSPRSARLRPRSAPQLRRPRLRPPRGQPGTPGGSHRADRPGARPDTPSTAPRLRGAPGGVPVMSPAGGGRGDTPQPEAVRVSRHGGVPQLPAPWEGDTAIGWRRGRGRRGTRLL